MEFTAECQFCHRAFTAKHKSAKWCSTKCSNKAWEARKKMQAENRRDAYAPVLPLGDLDVAAGPVSLPSVLKTVEAKLIGIPDSEWEKAIALQLANRLDNSTGETGASIQKMILELDRIVGKLTGSKQEKSAEEDDFVKQLDNEIETQRSKKIRRRFVPPAS